MTCGVRSGYEGERRSRSLSPTTQKVRIWEEIPKVTPFGAVGGLAGWWPFELDASAHAVGAVRERRNGQWRHA